MALRLYHDENATQEITDQNPDKARQPVEFGENFVDEKMIYVKSDNPDHEYEDIMITSIENPDPEDPEVTVEYALDNNGVPGTYQEELELPNGKYTSVFKLWRKATSLNVMDPFKRLDIKHRLKGHAYIAD